MKAPGAVWLLAAFLVGIVVGMKILMSQLADRPDVVTWTRVEVPIRIEPKVHTVASIRDSSSSRDSVARAHVQAIDSTNEHARADSIVRAELVRKSGKFSGAVPDTLALEDTTTHVQVWLPMLHTIIFDGMLERFSMTTAYGEGRLGVDQKHTKSVQVLERGFFLRLLEDVDIVLATVIVTAAVIFLPHLFRPA